MMGDSVNIKKKTIIIITIIFVSILFSSILVFINLEKYSIDNVVVDNAKDYSFEIIKENIDDPGIVYLHCNIKFRNQNLSNEVEFDGMYVSNYRDGVSFYATSIDNIAFLCYKRYPKKILAIYDINSYSIDPLKYPELLNRLKLVDSTLEMYHSSK